MKKLLNLMMASALIAFASCSNDESVKPGNDDTSEAQYYLTVNIRSAQSAMGRAEGDDVLTGPNSGANENDFAYGSADEHDIRTANFFFFDAQGIYVAQANVWNGGESVEGTNPNVEFLGKNVVVLKGLTERQTPKYMVTVLNAPDELVSGMLPGETSLADFRDKQLTFYKQIEETPDEGESATKSKKNLFVMSTSSYIPDGDNQPSSIGNFYGATELNTGNLVEDPDKLEEATPVDVYVERLAAKFTFNGKAVYPVSMTIGGEENNNAVTNVVVKITGLAVTMTADKSYLVKKLVIPSEIGTWSWNDDTNKRSYWGQSLYYEKATEEGLVKTPFSFAQANGSSAAVYANENTKPFKTIQGNDNYVKSNLVTNIAFTASIEIGDKPAKLVNYGGVYYLEDNFKTKVLEQAKLTDNGLNFYKQTKTQEDGVEKNNYSQVVIGDFKFERYANEKNADIKMIYSGNSTDELYSLAEGDDGKDVYTRIEDNGGKNAVAQLNEVIASAIGTTVPTYYNGYTYYTIPIEHLLGQDDNYKVTGDGQFGVVRNHWYNFELNNITRLGQGVFDPDEGGDVLYPEDPGKKNYALKAKVNILSWKIVKQTININ